MAIAVIIAPLELIGGLLKIYDPNSFQRLNIWKTAIEGIYFYPIWVMARADLKIYSLS